MNRNQFTASDSMEWKALEEPGVTGIWVKALRFDAATGRAPTFLLRFDAGAAYPAHDHPGGEECFVLEGELRLGGDHLRAGDYLYTAPGNKHGARSETGCVVLFCVPEEAVRLRFGTAPDYRR